VEYFNHLGGLITEDAKRTLEIKSRIFVAKNDIQQDGHSLHQQVGFKFKEKIIKVLYLKHSFVWGWNFDSYKNK